MLSEVQQLEMRQLAVRRFHTGELPGEWAGGAVGLANVLLEYGFEIVPGTGERVFARHPLGRVYRFDPVGSGRWTYTVQFDPTQGLRAAPPEDEEEAAARKRSGGRQSKADLPGQYKLFSGGPLSSTRQAAASMWWDGRTPLTQGRFLGFDIESTLIVDGEFPQVVLASAATEEGEGVLLEPEMIADFFRLQLERQPRKIWCGWNIAELDLPSLEYRLPGFTQAFHDRLIRRVYQGYFYDSLLFAKLLDIARYGQLYKPGGKIVPGPWADKGGYYSLAAQCERYLGFRPPKGEGLTFGEYLGRPREISEDQAAYALGDSAINAAIQKVMYDDPFTWTVAKKARQEMLAIEGQVFDWAKKPGWHTPIDHVAVPVPLQEGPRDEYDPLVQECALIHGWQSNTIQVLGTYGASWGNRNGIGVDVVHTASHLEELEVDVRTRMEMFGGSEGQVVVEHTTDKKGAPLEIERMALPLSADLAVWLPRLRQTILDWSRPSWERDRPLDLVVEQVPVREFMRPFRGVIRASRHFPTVAQLRSGQVPSTYLVLGDVADDYNAERERERFKISEKRWGDLADTGTKTGQVFSAGEVIRWAGTAGWVVLEGDEAEQEIERIVNQGVTDMTLGKMKVDRDDGYIEELEEDEEEDFEPESREPFKGYAYPFTTKQGTNATAIDAYIRECVLPLPPVSIYQPGSSPIDAIPTRGKAGAFYRDLVEKVGRKRDQWLMIFGASDVDEISDPVLREYFMLKRAEKELGAVKTYLPGYVKDRNRLRQLPLEQLMKALNLEKVKRSRIYPSTNALGAATGRSGMNNPNLQQVSQDRRHRGSFVPRIGSKLIVTDIGGAEMATQAEIFKHRYSKLPQLQGKRLLADYMNEGFDPHLLTGMQFRFGSKHDTWMPILSDALLRAVKMAPNEEIKANAVAAMLEVYPNVKFDMGDSGEDIAKGIWVDMLTAALGEEKGTIKDSRQAAKVPNFGLPGGMQANRLISVADILYNVQMSIDEAHEAIRAWKTIFPDGALWLSDGVQHLVRPAPLPAPQWGYYDNCFTLTGRLRGQLAAAEPTPEWKLRKMRQEGREEPYDEGLNEWHNTQFQGLCADGAKLGLYLAMRDGLRIVNFVHDEIGYEVPEARLDEQRPLAQDALRLGMAMVMTMVMVSIGATTLDRWKK